MDNNGYHTIWQKPLWLMVIPVTYKEKNLPDAGFLM